MAKTLTLTLGYKDTNFIRKMKFGGLSDADLTNLVANVQAFNASIAGGTDDGLNEFFVSDDFDATNNIGTLAGITAASTDDSTDTFVV